MKLCMFKINDKVVCIQNGEKYLTFGKTYEIINISSPFIAIKNDNNEISVYYFIKFMLLKSYNLKYREQKIKKILK